MCRLHQACNLYCSLISHFDASLLIPYSTAGADPYCIVKCGRSKAVTPVKKNTLNPNFNASVQFFVSNPGSAEVTVEVSAASLMLAPSIHHACHTMYMWSICAQRNHQISWSAHNINWWSTTCKLMLVCVVAQRAFYTLIGTTFTKLMIIGSKFSAWLHTNF